MVSMSFHTHFPRLANQPRIEQEDSHVVGEVGEHELMLQEVNEQSASLTGPRISIPIFRDYQWHWGIEIEACGSGAAET